MEVMANDVKPRTDYWLTYDFWPHGGSKVRMTKRVPAKDIWRWQRGEAVELRDSEGRLFYLHPKAWIFGTPPNTQVQP